MFLLPLTQPETAWAALPPLHSASVRCRAELAGETAREAMIVSLFEPGEIVTDDELERRDAAVRKFDALHTGRQADDDTDGMGLVLWLALTGALVGTLLAFAVPELLAYLLGVA